MNRKPEDPLAAWTDAALKQLPVKAAPARFAHRVLERIRHEAAKPWYRKPWLHWPMSLRLVSVGTLGGVIFAAAQLGQPASERAVEQVDQAVAYSSTIESIGRACLLCLAGIHPWILATLAVVITAAALVTCGCGALYLRLAENDR